jgi:dinuclear metal center YbgI/SA1388 family protein
MLTVSAVADFLEQFAPLRLAAEWDNVGLLVGDSARPVERIMTCLTLTPESVAEAVRERVDLVVAHHPLPFRPLKRLTADSAEGRMLLELIAARVAVFSPHTAFDSAGRGINQQLADGVGLTSIEPLLADGIEPSVGTGRCGRLAGAVTLSELALRVGQFLRVETVQAVGRLDRPVQSVAVACGSAGELLAAAGKLHCDALITGEARFHVCLEAEASEMSLVLAGHFASERFGLEQLAEILGGEFPAAKVWASRSERDPLQLVRANHP